MTITYKLAVISSLLLVAGCSSFQKRQFTYDESNQPEYSSSSEKLTYQPGTAAPSTTNARAATPTSNQGLVTQVQQQLNQDPSLAPLVPNIQISFDNGTVTLSGNVPGEQEKQKIEAIAKSTSGVVSVNNQLQILAQSQFSQPATTPFPATPPTDQSVAEKSSPSSPPPSQSSATQDQGSSPTSDRPDTSRVYGGNQPGAAQNVLGVNVQGATEADRSLGQQIAQELKTDTMLAGLLPSIKINVETGKVTLRGTVKSEDEKKKIESAVQRVTGVANIDDQLQIGTTGGSTQY